ncbi:ABC transporter permease [bacterium]|nr:ABC transporter permease [bacterium]
MESLTRISAVAQTTFRETIRNKILHNMLGFAVVMFGLSWVISAWSVGEPEKIIADIGLTITVLVGVIIAIFAGVVLVHGEVDRKTILPILAKPLHRWEYVLGKYIGFSSAVLLVYIGMNVILILFLSVVGGGVSSGLLKAMYLSIWEVELVVALALMFSSITTPWLSALNTIILFIAGRFSYDIKFFLGAHPGNAFAPVLKIIYVLVPNLSYFNLRHEAVHAIPVSAQMLIYPTLYGIIYCSLVLLIASLAFRTKDLA